MKNRSLILFLLICLFIPSVWADQLVDRGAKITFFVGKVMIKKGNAKEWKDVKLNQKLSSTDGIRTMVESRVDIETPEGTIINILENTVFELSDLFENTRTKATITKVNVKTGSILANVKKLTNTRSSFEFETPTATAAIRGTELGIDVLKGRTTVTVKEGSVEVKSKSGGKPSLVFTNQQATVFDGKRGVTVEAGKSGANGKKNEDDVALELTLPTDGMVSKVSAVPFQGKTTPGAIVKVNGLLEITPAADGSFAGTFTFPDATQGDTDMMFTAIKNGKTATKSVKIILDKTGGIKNVMLSVSEPAANALVPGEWVRVAGLTTPGAIVKFGDGQEITSADGKFSVTYKLPGKEPGNYEVKVTADYQGSVQTVTVPVSIIETPKEMILIINSPAEGEEIVRKTQIPVDGVTLPNAKVTFGSGTSVIADASGAFRGIVDIPKKYGVQELTFTSTLNGKSQKVTVKINVSPGTAGCAVEILEPTQGSEVPLEFEVRGSVDNSDNSAVVYVNGVQSKVSGNSFVAKIHSGFRLQEGERLSLTVTSPTNGATLNKLPVIIRGRVTPALAKVFLDGTKEAKVMSDGTFEAEYPMSDETGDYQVEISAVLESGETVKRTFDVIAQSECNGIKSQPVKSTVNINLGAAQASGETKTPLSFHYEKQKYPMILTVLPQRCVGNKIEIEVKTNAVELRANDKVVPLKGAGGTLKNYKHIIDNTDVGCFAESDVTFQANDDAADPATKEITVNLTCALRNTQKPQITANLSGRCLNITVYDESFKCEKADEEISVTVDASGQGQIEDYTVTTNGKLQCVNRVDGVNVVYTIKATDKGNNISTLTVTDAGYVGNSRPVITLIHPPATSYTHYQRVTPPNPPDRSSSEGEIEISFRIDGVDDARLISKVEFRPGTGKTTVFQGAAIPSDLTFDNIFMTYSVNDFSAKGTTKTLTYTIRLWDITGKEWTPKQGTITIKGR